MNQHLSIWLNKVQVVLSYIDSLHRTEHMPIKLAGGTEHSSKHSARESTHALPKNILSRMHFTRRYIAYCHHKNSKNQEYICRLEPHKNGISRNETVLLKYYLLLKGPPKILQQEHNLYSTIYCYMVQSVQRSNYIAAEKEELSIFLYHLNLLKSQLPSCLKGLMPRLI